MSQPHIQPARLPEVRAKAVAARESDIGRDVAIKVHQKVRGQSVEAAVMYWRAETEILRQAVLYHVSDEMSRLSGIAGRTLTDVHLRPWDAPSPVGLAWFDSPIGTSTDGYPIRAASWSIDAVEPELTELILAKNDGTGSVWLDENGAAWIAGITLYTHPDDMEYPDHGRLVSGELIADWESMVTFGDSALRGKPSTAWLTLVSAWLLMQQQVADIVDLQLRPALARKYARRKYDRRAVRVVTMGAHHAPPTAVDAGHKRGYQHRWVVRGHWRNHWYPKQKRHVPRWISPHIKGPDGAPILDPQETVHAWK